jgi:hypothetical protein
MEECEKIKIIFGSDTNYLQYIASKHNFRLNYSNALSNPSYCITDDKFDGTLGYFSKSNFENRKLLSTNYIQSKSTKISKINQSLRSMLKLYRFIMSEDFEDEMKNNEEFL